MTARPELLALIRHAKDDLDDVPRRLVLADWLEEHGDDADRARGRAVRWMAEGTAHHEILTDLSHRYRREWFGGMEEWGEPILGDANFTSWRPHPNLLHSSGLGELVRTEAMAWVVSMRVVANNAAGMERLVECGLLSGAVDLSFDGGPLGPEGAAALARLPAEVVLRRLVLVAKRLGLAGVRALADAAFLPRLRELNLMDNRLGPESVRALAAAPLDSIRTLCLGWSDLGDGLAHLASAGWLPSLKRLTVVRGGTLERGAVRLIECGPLTSLTDLSLSGSPLGPGFCEALTRSASLPRLEWLDLGYNDLGGGVVALANWPGARRLRGLSLGGVRLTEAAVAALIDSPYLDGLVHLNLNDAAIPGDVTPLRERFGDRLIL